MTDLFVRILEKNGLGAAALIAVLYMVWRAAPWLASRVDRSLDRTDTALGKLTTAQHELLKALAQHELNGEKRYSAMREHVADTTARGVAGIIDQMRNVETHDIGDT